MFGLSNNIILLVKSFFKNVILNLLGLIIVIKKTKCAPDCMLVVPQFPLTYNGLITPYQLQSVNPAMPCDMKNFATSGTFVEATIFDPDTNKLFVYHPLVVNFGTQPLVPPTTFVMPPNAIVGLWFGTNANTLTLTPLTSIQQGLCVNGAANADIFGQFAHCNGIKFFEAVNTVINSGQ